MKTENTNPLQEKIMVVALHISKWTAHKFDKKVSYDVERANDAHDAGKFNKRLIDGTELTDIQSIKNQARTFHYFNTLPWGDNGERVLPAASYFDYIQEINKLKAQFDKSVTAFLKNYEVLKQQARVRLGRMYNPADYPSEADIREKCGIRVTFMPLPDIEDFRISLQDEEVERIREDMRVEVQSRLESSIADIKERVKEVLERMVLRLDDKESIFRDSLVNNLIDLTKIMPKLNFANDPKITDLVTNLKSLCVEPKKLRDDDKTREKVYKRAKQILRTLK